MTLEETEIDRIRFEDLSESLKDMINKIASFDDEDYIALRTTISEISSTIDTNSSVCVGDTAPSVISLGKTVYFNSVEHAVQIAAADGSWVYLK